jgi:hypothetical protein
LAVAKKAPKLKADYYGTGRRKTAVAKVWMVPGKGRVVVRSEWPGRSGQTRDCPCFVAGGSGIPDGFKTGGFSYPGPAGQRTPEVRFEKSP